MEYPLRVSDILTRCFGSPSNIENYPISETKWTSNSVTFSNIGLGPEYWFYHYQPCVSYLTKTNQSGTLPIWKILNFLKCGPNRDLYLVSPPPIVLRVAQDLQGVISRPDGKFGVWCVTIMNRQLSFSIVKSNYFPQDIRLFSVYNFQRLVSCHIFVQSSHHNHKDQLYFE